jgi:hypothetical protein
LHNPHYLHCADKGEGLVCQFFAAYVAVTILIVGDPFKISGHHNRSEPFHPRRALKRLPLSKYAN